MKTFLETWLSEIPGIFEKEFSAEAYLTAVEHPPAAINSVSLAVMVAGSRAGKFTILTDRDDLHALFADAKVTNSISDAERDREVWKGLLGRVAQMTADAIGNVQIAAVEEADWTLGIPVASYQLHLGSAAMRIAFADQVRDIPGPAGNLRSSHEIPEGQARNIRSGVDLLMDVELEASLRFGSREMSLNEVLELGPGDVVELDRHAAEPVDLLVGDKIVARGEVVLVNGNFGFSVTQVAEPEKRLESIRCLF
jgi:flagellar motor switch protein FliN/FliY